jgi:hypothetical protein
MRTTLVLDDEVLRKAKIKAAELGVTLGEFVSLAVRDALRIRSAASESRFRMITFGETGSPIHRSPAELKAALEAQDVESGRSG